MYYITRVTTHPCNEHVELLPHMCGLMENLLHEGMVFCVVVTEVELDCGPEVSTLLL